MGPLRLLGGAVLGFAVTLAPAFAQPHAATAATDLEIPGGVEPLARVLGLDPSTAVAARIIGDAGRVAYSVPEGQAENLRVVAILKQYFDAVDVLTAINGRLSLPSAAPATDRRVVSLFGALGLTVVDQAPRVRLAAGAAAEAQRELLERAGVEIQPIVDGLNRGETVTVSLTPGYAPLPLGAAVWSRILPRKASERPLYRAILEDRQACLLYVGLSAVDPETLAALAASEGLLRDLYDRAAVFAANSRMLRIRRGGLVVPGGQPASPLWESVVGAPATDPAAFVRRLYSGEGRIAFMFDTIGSADDARQKFALGLWIPNASDRLDRFRRLASLFSAFDESWKIRATPFSHPAMDPALALVSVRVGADGSPTAPSSRPFWTAVLSETAADSSRTDWTGEEADAAWLLGRALEAPVVARRPRVERMAFANRLLQSGVTDLGAVVRAANGFARFPALMETLERIPVTEPSLYGDAAQRAASLDALDSSRAHVALAQFQSAAAIVERARFARTLSAAGATALMRSLVAVNIVDSGYDGGIARWIDRSLLPAVAASDHDAEAAVLHGIAGVSPARPVPVTWEDARYVLDIAAADFDRLERLRREQRTPSLGSVLAFTKAVAAMPEDGGVTDDVRSSVAAIRLDRDPRVIDGLRDSVQDVQADARAGHLRARDKSRLTQLGDRLLAYTLLSIVYAASLGDPDGDPTTIFDPQLGDRHEFSRIGGRAWTIPHEESGSGQPWHMQGSLLALDVGLARFTLRRLSTEPPLHAPRVSSNDRATFAETAALLNGFDLQDADAAAIAASVARGHARIAQLTTAPDAASQLEAIDAEVRIGAASREAIRWSLAHDVASVPALFSLVDAFWLGGPPAALVDRLDLWGLSPRPLDGALVSRFPRAAEWETFAGRPSIGLIATRTPELVLRVAMALDELKLPAGLARGIVSAATLDLVDEAPLGHRDDRRGVARFAETLSTSRIQDYVSLLTANGPLVPAR
jgi:hypothetical protein